jgi:hypothetical protein
MARKYSFGGVTRKGESGIPGRCESGGGSGEAGQFGAGGVGEEGEDADAWAWREFAGGGGAGVADDGGGLVEAASPAGAGDVAENEAFVFDSGGFEDGAGDLHEVGPAGGYADEAPM